MKDIKKDCEKIIALLASKDVMATIYKVNDGPIVRRIVIDCLTADDREKVSEIKDSEYAAALGVDSVKRIFVRSAGFYEGIEYARTSRLPWKVRFDDHEAFRSGASKDGGIALPVIIGKGYSQSPLIEDLARVNNLLLIDKDGRNRGAFFETTIAGLAHKYSPTELKFVLVDSSERVFAKFKKLPHLLVPVITDHRKFVFSMNWFAEEKGKRFRMLDEALCYDIEEFNNRDVNADMVDGLPQKLPYLILISDQFDRHIKDNVFESWQDMLIGGSRLGIYVMASTGNLSARVLDSISGYAARFRGRIVFKVPSAKDSDLALGFDDIGAERLVADRDAIYYGRGSFFQRLQTPCLSAQEIKKAVTKRSK